MSVAAPDVGLLAGAGRFPIAFAEKAKELGLSVFTVGLRRHASTELIGLSTEFHWTGLGGLGRVIRRFKKAGVREIVMAGKVQKSALLGPWGILTLIPDLRAIQFWYSRIRRDNKDDSLLSGVIAEFAKDGIRFGSALDYCPELLVQSGTLTRRSPTAAEAKDVAFGWELAKEMGRLDVGQSVAVRERAVLAIEAIEGTDQAIARAGALCRRAAFVVVKVAKPQQDMRFDVPTVGCTTIETMHQAGGRVLAVEAGKTILLDEPATIALADRYGIAIVAVESTALSRAA
jgi:DUF1009 family protein